jgi:AcrR family transcriptional regulator
MRAARSYAAALWAFAICPGGHGGVEFCSIAVRWLVTAVTIVLRLLCLPAAASLIAFTLSLRGRNREYAAAFSQRRIDNKQTTVYFFCFSQNARRESSASSFVKRSERLPTGAVKIRNERRRKPRLRLSKMPPGKSATKSVRALKDRAAPSVRERILEVAERLFAEHGMAGVGLRAITAEAKVNLASIAYHFGSKDGLLEALFAQRAAPIAQERLRLLALCTQDNKQPELESILDAFLRPALTLGVQPRFGGPAFVKLRARLGMEPEATTRKILSKAFDLSSRQFIDAIARALPRLPRAEVEWRFHFMLGAMFYTMANSGRIQSLTSGRIDPGKVKRALHHMSPFLAAGFRSPPIT